MKTRALALALLLSLLVLTPACGCIPERDPNLSERKRQTNTGCKSPYGVSPVVPYQIEGGSGWR